MNTRCEICGKEESYCPECGTCFDCVDDGYDSSIKRLQAENQLLKTQLVERTHHHSDAWVEAEVVVLREALALIVEDTCDSDEDRNSYYLATTALTNTSNSTAKVQAVLDAAEKFQSVYEAIVDDPNSVAITLDVLLSAILERRGEL